MGSDTYTYDLDGNLISKTQGGQTFTYTYDVENRLIQVVTPDGTWNYEYDALGNRIASVKDGQRTEYLLDPTGLVDVVGEYGDTGSPIARYIHGLGLVSRADASNYSYYDTDAIGSVIGLSGTTGSYFNRYSYLPFGEDLTKVEAIANPFEYVGQFGVMDEGNGLDFMRARFYDGNLGRFTSVDPLGLRGGDGNLYRYTLNSPTGLIDPLGLSADDLGLNDLKNKFTPKKIGRFLNQAGAIAGLAGLALGLTAGATVGSPIWATLAVFGLLTSLFGNALEDPKSNFSKDFLKSTLSNLHSTLEIANAYSEIILAFDPNDIIGPSGFGEQNYLIPSSTFPYTIRYENQASATAPAVFVTVTQQLDEDLNLNTFELGDFGFGSIYIDVPTGLKAYSTRVDLTSTIGYFVDFNASLDDTTRTVTWQLTTIDPVTGGLPSDADAGFLPPNNENHDGEGFLNYTISPKANLPTNTIIDAEAEIIFDFNTPIDTPKWTNTIDVDAPTSQVSTLPSISTTNFTVSWAGSDNGSGIASYDIYVSTDGSQFVLWKDNISETSATFNGQPGRTYAFYSIAVDNVGLTEAAPIAADTQTIVNTAPTISTISNQTTDEDTTKAITFTIADTETAATPFPLQNYL